MGQEVRLVKDVSETDQFGRLLRYVYVGEWMVNAQLVADGWAQAATYPPDVRHADHFNMLTGQARQANRGCWGIGVWGVPDQPSAGTGDVQLAFINYDGVVPRVESDEYAEIVNRGASPVNLGGWRLNAGDPGQDFGFPGFELQPGQSCRVYTNEFHPESCGFSFGRGQAIWNNSGDCGYLYDAAGNQVSQLCY